MKIPGGDRSLRSHLWIRAWSIWNLLKHYNAEKSGNVLSSYNVIVIYFQLLCYCTYCKCILCISYCMYSYTLKQLHKCNVLFGVLLWKQMILLSIICLFKLLKFRTWFYNIIILYFIKLLTYSRYSLLTTAYCAHFL